MYNKNRPQTIQKMFNSIAKRYDLTNAVLSCYLHKRWNHELVRRVLCDQTSHTLLDLCSGTGDIAFDYLRSVSTPCRAYLVDFSKEMLNCAKEKADQLSFSSHSLEYIQADVHRLPFLNQSVDCATMAYGIRNVHHPAQCIQEVYRVLKPGGCLGILELTRPSNRLLRYGHQIYLRTLLPLFGKWLTANEEAYQYLRQSIHTFIPPGQLEALFRENGFIKTGRYSLNGGIATIITGYKPMSGA
ncbi:bifunctional demethylmenaquinone methyltransferase/2-methoxy-6-polyprenyl-1,4-benzoquinol methylase UbiE [Candidatus Protochlamydia phocaeensis]|uniref:bifunctional demethylmenaquinone methyltransferase/2-methoxy-6-polyprenyl-1,4-benzoquinol methylase UbiE n=1 Tax=Candidatus Protochlamydia phocaeensis TaxID=1414722 RepID=UPI000837E0C9|nr:bifunctional demethylmenaquinone methyltransferase/2-methoxy-6-polyprenyl-1,4-benzoquinol methylase UbiE [Candidatus Protochlamydia phocaeensis]